MSDSDQYTAYLRDVANIGARYETSRRFYLTLLSGLSVFLSLSGPEGPFSSAAGPLMVFVGLAGCGLCYLWHIHMLSYGAIFRAKFDALRAMENQNNLFPLFTTEGDALEKQENYKKLTQVDSLPPVLFGLLIGAITLVLAYLEING